MAIDKETAAPTVIRDLLVNGAMLAVCLGMQLLILCTQGPSHTGWQVYVAAIGGLLAVACVSFLMAYKGWIVQAMHLYAWSGMLAIVAMTVAGMEPGEDLPSLMVLLICAGAAWLYGQLNWPSAVAYATVALGAFVGMGITYEQLDDTVPAIFLLGLALAFGARLWRYNQLRTAIRMMTNGGSTSGT